MVVHPTYRNTVGHAAERRALARSATAPGVQPGILTRLDKDTSGWCSSALTPAPPRARCRRTADRMQKQYLAVVRGTPDPPPRDASRCRWHATREDRRRVIVDRRPAPRMRDTLRGDRAGCACRPMRNHLRGRGASLITGRTHQIRVHLAAQGWPIVGDARLRRAPTTRIARQALHAWRITLPHPVTRRAAVSKRHPEDMCALLPGRHDLVARLVARAVQVPAPALELHVVQQLEVPCPSPAPAP